MKKFIFIVGFILFSANLFAQNNEPFLSDAKKDFAKLYYSIPFGKDFNWFERFCEANAAFYSLHSEFVIKHFSELKKKKNYKDDDELIAAVADSINTWFLKYHALDSVPTWWNQLNELLPPVTQQICDCIYKTKRTDTLVRLDNEITKCYSAYSTDASLVAKIQAAFKGKPMDEMLLTSKLVSEYAMLNCKPLYIFSKKTANTLALEQFNSSISFLREGAMEKIIRYAIDKNIDSLSILFPLHKKFERDIVTLKNSRGKLDYSRTSSSSDETPSYTYTFFKTNNKKAVVTSQVVMEFDANHLDVVVKKLQFIERSKITRLTKLEKELNDVGKILPPPPMEK